MVKRWCVMTAAVAVAACSGATARTANTPSPAGADGPAVLRDMDQRPIEVLPPEILADVRRQMLERGDTSAARQLEKTYDFETGRLRAAAAPVPSQGR
jgi:hypothetical protein